MVQLHVLSGRAAGSVLQPASFPCILGRSPECALSLQEPGVWEQHLEFDVRRGEGVRLRLLPPALATVNGQPFEQVLLRNGDVIDAGGVRLRFWLAEPRQRGLRLREALTWAGLAALCALQLAAIYLLTH